MFMDDDAFSGAVNEVVALYQDVCDHNRANPDEREVLSGMFSNMLGVAMDNFLHDIDSVNVSDVRVMLSRTVLDERRIAELARAGLKPYQMPVTREELLGETPGMIPLLLARTVFCVKFHGMPVRPRLMGPNWMRFANHYACKMPKIC